MLIGEVARRAGVRASTIRFYETRQIITPARRAASGYRRYGPTVLAELAFVERAQRLGFSLDEVREILAVGRGGRAPCERVAALCGEHLRDIDRRMVELRTFRKHLRAAQAQAEQRCGFTPEGFCAAIMGAPSVKKARPPARRP